MVADPPATHLNRRMTNQPGHDEVSESVEVSDSAGDDAAPQSLGALLDQGGEVEGLATRPSVEDGPKAQRLRFTATGWEYFRIWIVNVALTLATLGIYSAWAKVRARRYLYGHVWLGDTSFDYTANPVAILRGRILVAVVATILWFANLFSLWYYYAALAVLMPLVPWVVVKARTFQLRNSRYRGIAFDFQGKYWDAAVWYPLTWVASFVTLGLAWPFRVFGRDRYLIDESSLGNKPFRFNGEAGPYYGVYITVWIMGVLLFFLTCTAIVTTTFSDEPSEPSPVTAFLLPVFIFVITLFSIVYIRTRLLSYRWSNTQLGDSDFILNLSFGTMFWLYLSNTVAIVCTFGLFTPFARIRMLRYVVDQFLVMQPVGDITVEASESQRLGATGAEAAGEFGLEIGI